MAAESFERDYAKYYDFFNEGKDYAGEVKFLQDIFYRHGAISTRDILNLGCGTGMHEMHLSPKGYRVTGLDLSPEMIDIAKQRRIPYTSFSVGDMSQFELGKRFDACTSMFAAFGYLTENGQIDSALKDIKRHLLPHGLVVLEVWNGSGVLNIKPSSRVKEFSRDGIHVHRQSFPTLNSLNQRVDIDFKIKLTHPDQRVEEYEERHRMRYFFPQEMRHYLDVAGFDTVETCTAFTPGISPTENDWNMVVVGKARP